MLRGVLGSQAAAHGAYFFFMWSMALVGGVYIATFQGGNLSWMLTLPVSKKRVWAANYVGSMATIAIVTLAMWLAAAIVEAASVPKVEYLTAPYRGVVVAARAHFAQVFGAAAAPRDGTMFALYFGLSHFVSGFLEYRPTRALGRGVIELIVLAGVGAFAVSRLNSPGLLLVGTVAVATWIMISNTRQRLEMSWRQFGPLAAYMALIALTIVGPPVIGAVRGLRSASGEEYLRGRSFLGRLAGEDADDVGRLLAQRLRERWRVAQLLELYHELPGAPRALRLDADPRVDVRAVIAAQDEPGVLLELADELAAAGRGGAEGVRLVGERLVQINPRDEDTALKIVEATLATLATDGGASEVEQWLRRPEPLAIRTGLLLARYVPEQRVLDDVRRTLPRLGAADKREAALTIGLLTGQRVGPEDVTASAHLQVKPAGVCEDFSEMKHATCSLLRACARERSERAMRCAAERGVDLNAVNTCVRRIVRTSGAKALRIVTGVEALDWIDEIGDTSRATAIAEALQCPSGGPE
jgi:hypothetical protein